MKLPDPKAFRRFSLDVLGIVGALLGLWCLYVHADLAGAALQGGVAAATAFAIRFAWAL